MSNLAKSPYSRSLLRIRRACSSELGVKTEVGIIKLDNKETAKKLPKSTIHQALEHIRSICEPKRHSHVSKMFIRCSGFSDRTRLHKAGVRSAIFISETSLKSPYVVDRKWMVSMADSTRTRLHEQGISENCTRLT